MALYYSNSKSFSNKISRIFWFEKLYVRPLLATLKGQYWPWAQHGRPGQGWYGWISTFWCHSKLPYDGHSIPGLPKQIMPTLLMIHNRCMTGCFITVTWRTFLRFCLKPIFKSFLSDMLTIFTKTIKNIWGSYNTIANILPIIYLNWCFSAAGCCKTCFNRSTCQLW